MSKTLVELVQESNELEVMLIQSEGVLTPEIEQALSVSETALSEKVDGYVHVLDRLNFLQEYYKAQAKKFDAIAKRCENCHDHLKENLKFAMDQMKTAEIHGSDFRFVKVPTSGTLEITDEDLIPIEYKTEKSVTVIDKARLKKDAADKEIPGAKLVSGSSIRSYPNTRQIGRKKESK